MSRCRYSPALVVLLTLGCSIAPATAQDEAEQKVTIERIQVTPTPADRYRATVVLEPAEVVDLVAPSPGYLRTVLSDPGDAVQREAEVARMENEELQLEYERAKALHRVAEAELEIAKAESGESGNPHVVARAQAGVEAAEAAESLAKLRYERSSIRSPLAGVVFENHARPGRFLQAGTLIATIGDVSKLRAAVPMRRADATEGKQIDLKVEDGTARGTIKHVQPLTSRFDALRDLVNDAVVAIVEIDNAGGKNSVGQTVHSPLVPREPVALLPNSAIGNAADGRRVQVIREGVVRDIPVVLLSGIGEDRSYVSGNILESDEVVVSASTELVAGTPVRKPTDEELDPRGRPVRPGVGRRPVNADPARPIFTPKSDGDD